MNNNQQPPVLHTITPADDETELLLEAGGHQPQPSVRITVTYHNPVALPESVDVVWEVDFPTPDTLAAILDQLLDAPRQQRRSTRATPPG